MQSDILRDRPHDPGQPDRPISDVGRDTFRRARPTLLATARAHVAVHLAPPTPDLVHSGRTISDISRDTFPPNVCVPYAHAVGPHKSCCCDWADQ